MVERGPFRVCVLLYEGFDELDAVAPFEVFANAATVLEQPVDVALVTLDDVDAVTASHGLRVGADGTLDAGPAPDLLVVPGGGWTDRSEAGARAEYERGAVPERIAAAHDAGSRVAAVCTGGMLLAGAGLLDGRPAVTHSSALDDLRATNADVVEARVVDAGSVVTAGGVTAGLDLALYLVGDEFGAAVADHVATEMEYERRGTVHRAADG